jgi:membrane-bound ClpP family serine protease
MATSEPNGTSTSRESNLPTPQWERTLLDVLQRGALILAIACVAVLFLPADLRPTAESLVFRIGGGFLLVAAFTGCLLMSRTVRRRPAPLRYLGMRLILLGGMLLVPLISCLAMLVLLLGSSPLSEDLHDRLIIPGMVLLALFLLGGALLLLGCAVTMVELIAEYRRSLRSARLT